MEFSRDEKAGQHGESLGTSRLYVDNEVVAEGPMRAQISKFTLCGDGLCVGFDSADRRHRQYPAGDHTRLQRRDYPGCGNRPEPKSYLDLEREATAAFARD